MGKRKQLSLTPKRRVRSKTSATEAAIHPSTAVSTKPPSATSKPLTRPVEQPQQSRQLDVQLEQSSVVSVNTPQDLAPVALVAPANGSFQQVRGPQHVSSSERLHQKNPGGVSRSMQVYHQMAAASQLPPPRLARSANQTAAAAVQVAVHPEHLGAASGDAMGRGGEAPGSVQTSLPRPSGSRLQLSHASTEDTETSNATVLALHPQTHTRRWTEEEVAALLEYWALHIAAYKTKKKADFYRKVSNLPPMCRKGEDQIRSKCNDIERRYKEIHQKLATTGFGVDEGEKRTLHEWVVSKFPLYYEVHEFLGTRSAINPPVIFESGVTPAYHVLPSSVPGADGIDVSLENLPPLQNGLVPTDQTSVDSEWAIGDDGDEFPLTQPSAMNSTAVSLTQASLTLNTSASDQGKPTEVPLTQLSMELSAHQEQPQPSAAIHHSAEPTPDTVTLTTTGHSSSQNNAKKSAAETLSDSLTFLSEKHINFEREKLSRMLEFESQKLEQTLKLENKKLEMKLGMHRDEMRAARQQHDEVMQLHQMKLEALLTNKEGQNKLKQNKLEARVVD